MSKVYVLSEEQIRELQDFTKQSHKLIETILAMSSLNLDDAYKTALIDISRKANDTTINLNRMQETERFKTPTQRLVDATNVVVQASEGLTMNECAMGLTPLVSRFRDILSMKDHRQESAIVKETLQKIPQLSQGDCHEVLSSLGFDLSDMLAVKEEQYAASQKNNGKSMGSSGGLDISGIV